MAGVIKLNCEDCGSLVPVAEVEWRGGAAICATCVAKEAAELDSAIPDPADYGVPVYIFYSTEGIPLHISRDIFTPLRWKDFQGDSWWYQSVGNIAVKFFSDPENADLAVERLRFNLQPLYGDYPEPSDPPVEEYADIYEMQHSGETLEEAISIRVSRDTYLALRRQAAKLCVPLRQYLRSILVAETIRHSNPSARSQESSGVE